jgi:hypothetical protein
MPGRARTDLWNRITGASLVLFVALALAGACASPAARAQKARLASLPKPLNELGEAGDVDAMRLIADIEVLRARGLFSDSLANALNRLPGTAFFGLSPDGKFGRVERGSDITTIVQYEEAEPALLKAGVITAQQVSEIHILIEDNMAAAVDMIGEVTEGRVGKAP